MNSIKIYGNIAYLRNLKEETDTALVRFSDKEYTSIVILCTPEDFTEKEMLPPIDWQNNQSKYLDIRAVRVVQKIA